MFRNFWNGQNYKISSRTLLYRFVIYVLTHCTTLFGNKFGTKKKQIKKIYLTSLLIWIGVTSQYGGVLYHLNAKSDPDPIKANVKSWYHVTLCIVHCCSVHHPRAVCQGIIKCYLSNVAVSFLINIFRWSCFSQST